MIRSRIGWLVPVALGLVSFGATTAPAHAQTNFSANYNTFRSFSPTSAPGVFQTLLSGQSTDAPEGLTNLTGVLYTQLNPATGTYSFNTDPTVFGVQAPPGSVVFFGNNNIDSLNTTESGTGAFNLPFLTTQDTDNFSGTSTITGFVATVNGIVTSGGEGRFSGATGTLALSGSNAYSPDRNISTGQLSVTGTIETVPEPNASPMTVMGMGVIGAGFLLRRSSLIALKKSN